MSRLASTRDAQTSDDAPSYLPAARLMSLRTLLETSSGLSVYDVMERLSVSKRSAWRLLRALEASGEPLYQDTVDRKTVFRLKPVAGRLSLRITTSQMVSLFLSRRVFDFLSGTGFREDLDEVFEKLRAALHGRDAKLAQNLDRKLYDVNEAPHRYGRRQADVGELVTALLKEEKLDVVYESRGGQRSSFVLRPYSLLVYKKGLYVAGEREPKKGATERAKRETRIFALDAFKKLRWLRGEGFDYPKRHDPSKLTDGAFGLFRGEPTRVRIRFDADVARYVERRRWHPTARVKKLPSGEIELEMRVAGTTEVVSWVLGFGKKAQVLEPVALVEQIEDEVRGMASRYGVG